MTRGSHARTRGNDLSMEPAEVRSLDYQSRRDYANSLVRSDLLDNRVTRHSLRWNVRPDLRNVRGLDGGVDVSNEALEIDQSNALRCSLGRRLRGVSRDIRYVEIPRYDQMTPEPPPGFWAPCHPATVAVFKASITCPSGHTLTLRNHRVAADGRVHPSIVCPEPGCSFHELVRLQNWSFGTIPARRSSASHSRLNH